MSVNHYENFPIASLLCPRALRPAVRAIYAYARTADDLADEGDAPAAQRLTDLAAFEADLHAVVAGHAPSVRWRTVFEPLTATLRRHALPLPLLTDLLSAFRQDVVQTSYADRAALLDYCRRSAYPVGRLMLHLYGIDDGDALRQSDAICGALQLANFWQDLSVDRQRGRLYIPLADARRFGVDASDLLEGHDSARVRALVAELVVWTRDTMWSGAPLAHRIPGRAGWELRFVVQGGLRILKRIERNGFDSLQRRPTLALRDALTLTWRAFAMRPTRNAVREEHA
ncbi:MAG: squalene synthase HpnC [Burkholderiales bacterium]